MQTSLQMGSRLLKGLGVMSDDVNFISQLVRDSMELQAQEALSKTEDRELDIMKPLQVLTFDLKSNNLSCANNFQYKERIYIEYTSNCYSICDPNRDWNIVSFNSFQIFFCPLEI